MMYNFVFSFRIPTEMLKKWKKNPQNINIIYNYMIF